MGRESTAHAKGILTDFITVCGGAQGAVLELKYGYYAKDFGQRASLGCLNHELLAVEKRIVELLAELE